MSVSWEGENARCGNKGFSGWPVVASRISSDFLGTPWRPSGAFPGAECTWSYRHGLGLGHSLRTGSMHWCPSLGTCWRRGHDFTAGVAHLFHQAAQCTPYFPAVIAYVGDLLSKE